VAVIGAVVGVPVLGGIVGEPVLGAFVGKPVFGAIVGDSVGPIVGEPVFGAFVGDCVFGAFVGAIVVGGSVAITGAPVGEEVAAAMGDSVGFAVEGTEVGAWASTMVPNKSRTTATDNRMPICRILLLLLPKLRRACKCRLALCLCIVRGDLREPGISEVSSDS
jgi:hypothetical protein